MTSFRVVATGSSSDVKVSPDVDDLELYHVGDRPPEDLFQALAGLVRLRRLKATAGFRTRLDALAGLGQLRELDLSLGASELDYLPDRPRPNADLRPLRALSLEVLELLLPLTNDLAPLAELRAHPRRLGLSFSDCAFAPAPELGPLAALSGTSELVLGSHRTRALDFLRGMRGLRSLDVTLCSQLADVSAIGGAPDLETCRLNVENLRDVSPLRALGKLRTLTLRKCHGYVPSEQTPVELDLSSLAGLPALEAIELVGVSLAKLDFVRSLPRLARFSLKGGRLAGDPGALASVPSLRALELIEVEGVKDWSWLERLTQLESLVLPGWLDASVAEVFRRANPGASVSGYSVGDPWGN